MFPPYVWDVQNVTGSRQDSEEAYNKIKNYIEDPTLQGRLVAIVTDSASVYVKAKRELSTNYPGITFLPRFAHQINLIVGDMMKTFPQLKRTLEVV